MGKRKSSPRLATTSSNDVVTSIISTIRIDIHINDSFFNNLLDVGLAILFLYDRIKKYI
ncbi:hypothetical protein [Bacillus tuaregi]|uniref:hypothetical protein n=1 Tax=Bacillus tuaregi TaxID=1816695 RepID=UPI001356514A|nr:hypothetical protein [Bacillus tuaregi]